jgi:catenin alpha
MWRMKAPEKKPLVRKEDVKELRSQIRKSAVKKNIEPVKALSEFQEMDTFC